MHSLQSFLFFWLMSFTVHLSTKVFVQGVREGTCADVD
jgi:hypothetical protein